MPLYACAREHFTLTPEPLCTHVAPLPCAYSFLTSVPCNAVLLVHLGLEQEVGPRGPRPPPPLTVGPERAHWGRSAPAKLTPPRLTQRFRARARCIISALRFRTRGRAKRSPDPRRASQPCQLPAKSYLRKSYSRMLRGWNLPQSRTARLDCPQECASP